MVRFCELNESCEIAMATGIIVAKERGESLGPRSYQGLIRPYKVIRPYSFIGPYDDF